MLNEGWPVGVLDTWITVLAGGMVWWVADWLLAWTWLVPPPSSANIRGGGQLLRSESDVSNLKKIC